MLRWHGKHYLTICALHKGEVRNLREWLDYHLLVGVEHFYLVCNDDDPRPTEWLLREYEGKVTHIHIPGRPLSLGGIQRVAYDRLISIAQARWAAFIDIDEFLFPSCASDVRSVLESFESYAGLAVHWKCFGSAGNLPPPQSVLRDVNRRPPLDFEANRHVKCIVEPRKVSSYENSHLPQFVPGEYAVDVKLKRIRKPMVEPVLHTPLCVHHYVVRSRVHVQERMKKGPCDNVTVNVTRFLENFDRNDVEDTQIWDRFGPLLSADKWC